MTLTNLFIFSLIMYIGMMYIYIVSPEPILIIQETINNDENENEIICIKHDDDSISCPIDI